MTEQCQIKVNVKNNHRFDIAALVFSYMVIMIHSSYASFYHASGAINTFLSDYYTDYISGFAVPAFFMMSSIKFYRNYDYSQTVRKFKSRIHSLLIPYLAWNFLSVIWIVLLSYMPVLSKMVVGREKFSFSASNVIGGLLWFKYIHPFWYMAMLMIFTLLCPVIYTLIKNKYVGLCTVGILYLIDALPISFPQTTWPMFQWRTIIYCTAFYLVGALIGKHGYDSFCKEPSKKWLIPSILCYCLSVAIRGITNNSDIVFIPMILLGSYSIWIIVGMIRIKKDTLISLSFFIYPAHTFVLPCVNKVLFLLLPRIEWISIVNTFLGTAITFVLCIFLGVVVRKVVSPQIWKKLNGGRDNSSVKGLSK